jgi:hypothetical protein
MISMPWVLLQGLTKILSLGMIDACQTDFIVVLRKTSDVTADQKSTAAIS